MEAKNARLQQQIVQITLSTLYNRGRRVQECKRDHGAGEGGQQGKSGETRQGLFWEPF
jgi:hypothetical protein